MKDFVLIALFIFLLSTLVFIGSFAALETVDKLQEVGLKNILEPLWNGVQNG